MVEFLRKSESVAIKWLKLLNSHYQIYQFTLILYDVGVHCDDIFKLTDRSQSVYRDVYGSTFLWGEFLCTRQTCTPLICIMFIIILVLLTSGGSGWIISVCSVPRVIHRLPRGVATPGEGRPEL